MIKLNRTGIYEKFLIFFSAAYKKTYGPYGMGNSLQFNLKIQKDQGINLLATIFIELEL